MLRNIKQLEGHALSARDGEIGHVRDFYFDDHHWHIRYLVVETGTWLDERCVLIAPEAIQPMRGDTHTFPTNLTTEQVRNSPSIDTQKPVSRQREEELREHYGWPTYWNPVFGVGGIAAPIFAPEPPAAPVMTDGAKPLQKGDPHLRSTNDTQGYAIQAADGAIGHVDDFLIDEDGWRIRYLVVDTRNWLPGKRVVIAPGWISKVSWTTKSVTIDLTRDAIKAGPPYDPSATWNAAYAAELHDYYRRPRYSDWERHVERSMRDR